MISHMSTNRPNMTLGSFTRVAEQEKFYFNPGDTGFKVFDTRFGKIGVAICWDQWFPEAARAMALQGAEVGVCQC